MTYAAPLKDIRFTLDHVTGLQTLGETGAFPDLTPDLADAVLSEAARLMEGVIAPLSADADRTGAARAEDGSVTTPPGFKEAYRQWVEGGWGGIPFAPAFGGQGLPRTLMLAVQEMLQGANPAFGLAPLLTQGAIEALTAHGTDEQKALFLPKLISGEWPGTMNLTEPQAGSDVGALRTKAERREDGTYAITGTKIWITYGEHDMAENIVHLVLARLPDAPPGTRGISLFLVPKFLVNPDGSLGARNDVVCAGIEHKLGIHGSPTCTMAYGEQGGAIGTLIGRENKGMACMFTMMNNARLNVGIQGVGVGQAAFQKAFAFARERKQGKPFGLQHDLIDMIPIIQHPDVRRMLWTMKAELEAARAICYANAYAADLATAHPNQTVRDEARGRDELLTPISKAYATDLGVELTSMGIQVHGGMGYMEETGAAQLFRDSRIFPIYEGTNGIQANDLVARKLPMDGGAVLEQFMDDMRATVRALQTSEDPCLELVASSLKAGINAVDQGASYMLASLRDQPADALAGAAAFLKLMGTVAGGHFLGCGALAARARLDAGDTDAAWLKNRIALARFYALTILPRSAGLLTASMRGADVLYDIDPDAIGEAG